MMPQITCTLSYNRPKVTNLHCVPYWQFEGGVDMALDVLDVSNDHLQGQEARVAAGQ
jgi:hypothetical protein